MASPLYLPLLLFLLGAIACLAAVTRKYLLNTVTIICCMWFVSVLLASLGLFAIRPYSERVYAIIAIGCVGVAAGDLLLRFVTQRVYGTIRKRSSLIRKTAYSLNMRAILCMQIFCTVYYVLMCYKTFQLLRSGFTFADLRTIHQGYANMESSLTNFQLAIGNHVAKSFMFLMIPAALVILFTGQKVQYRKTTLLLTVLDVCMYTLYTASRMILVVATLNALVLLVINQARVSKRMTKNIRRVGILVGAVVLIVTAFRVTNKGASGIWEMFYAYFSAPVPLMSYWIDRIDASVRPMNGLALTNGLLNTLDIFGKRFHLVIASHQECSAFISSFEAFIPVFGGSKINAFVSAFTYFYLDGRELGVFLLGGVMGMIGSYFEERTLKRPDFLSLLTYILLTQAVVKFLFKWELASSSYVLAFVYLRIVFVKRERCGITEKVVHVGRVQNVMIHSHDSIAMQKIDMQKIAAGSSTCPGLNQPAKQHEEIARVESRQKEAEHMSKPAGRRRNQRMIKEAERCQMEKRWNYSEPDDIPLGRRCRRRREIELYRSRVSELMRHQNLSALHNRDYKIRIIV